MHELRTFGYDIYPITSSPKKLYYMTQRGSLMSYTNIIATIKWWDPHTKKLKYCSSEIFDEHKENLVKDGHQVLNLPMEQIFTPSQH